MNICCNLKKIPERYQIAATGWISRFFMGFSQIISISILLKYLGTDLYAVFAVITGLQGWFALADCGVGSSLQNYISEARADNKSVVILNSNAVIVSIFLLVVSCITFVCVSPLLQYRLLHKINPVLAFSQYYLLIFVGVVYIAINIFGISYRVLFANRQGYWAYFYQGIGPIFAVAFIIVVRFINVHEYRLLLALLGWVLPQLIVSMISYVQVFSFKNVLMNIDFRVMKSILIRGVKFWIFAVSSAFTLLMDYIVMAQTLTTKDIAVYTILSKGFTLIIFIYTAVLTATWPEMAELFVKQRWNQANKILVKNMLLGIFLVVICSLVLIIAKNFVVLLLAPNAGLILPVTSIVLFGIYSIIRVWTDSYAVALLSQNHFKLFWIYVPIQAVLCFFGMYFLSLYYGMNGIIIGLILSFVLTASWMLPVFYFKKRAIYI